MVAQEFNPNKVSDDVISRARQLLALSHGAHDTLNAAAEKKWMIAYEKLAAEAGISALDLTVAVAAQVVVGGGQK